MSWKMNRVIIAMVALLVVTGCGGVPVASASPTPGVPQGSIVVWGFGGTFDAAMTSAVINPFKAKYPKVDVTIATAANSDQHLTKLKANKGHEDVDVDLIGGGLWDNAIRSGLYEKLDADQIPNLKQVYSAALGPTGYGPSVAFSGAGIAYNTDKVNSAPTSWNDLFNAAYKGHVAVPNLDNNIGLMLLAELAHLNGGSEKNIDPGFQKAQQLKTQQNPIFFTAAADEQRGFTNDSIWIAPMFDSQAHLLAKNGVHVGFVYPKEGGLVTQNMINVVAGTANKPAAEAFINFFLDATVQANWAAAVLYGPTNKNTKLDPALGSQVVYGSDLVNRMIYADWSTIDPNRAAWNDRWNREILAKS